MKLRRGLIWSIVSFLFVGVFLSLGFASNNASLIKEVEAASERTYCNGISGEVMYVSGPSSIFNNENHLAVYFFNSESVNAWTERISNRINDGYFVVPVPYLNGQSTQWSKYIVTSYNPGMNPQTDGWSGVYKQSNNIEISSFRTYGQNVCQITGVGQDDKLSNMFSYTYHYGVESQSHLYLDLTELPEWANDDAKLAMYFAFPNRESGSGWSSRYNEDHTDLEQSFCWKVHGQSNENLYECIAPKCYGKRVIWAMVIAVRLNSSAEYPSFDFAWNQTQDLNFKEANHEANIIRVTKNGESWSGGGYILDPEYKIANDTRASFYGQYFLDTVACSGDGKTDATTDEMWSLVKDEYKRYLSTTVEGEVWKASADIEGSTLEKAMMRYDYIVFVKEYAHEDFINRAESEGKISLVSIRDNTQNLEQYHYVIILVAVASITLIGTTTLILNKKRNER